LLSKIISIDLGSSSIKALQVQEGLKNFKILQFEEIEMSLSSESEYTARLIAALKTLETRMNFKGSKILLTMPTDKAIIRNFVFPFSDLNKISEVISFEVEENIPYPLDRISMDFQSVPGSSNDSRTVLLAAVEKNRIHEINNIFNDMGYNINFLGLESNSILGSYNNLTPDLNETTVQLDIGHRKTVINITDKGMIFTTRAVSTGISAITRGISEILKISENDAVLVLKKIDLDITDFEKNLESEYYQNDNISKKDLKKIYTLCLTTFQSILSDLNITLKSNNMETVSKVILCGGGAGIRGLDRLVTDILGISSIYMPFPSDEFIHEKLIKFTVCYGTVIDYLYNKKNNLNFIKGEFLPDISGKSWKIYYLPGFFIACSIFIFLITLGYDSYVNSVSSREIDRLMEKKYKRYFRTTALPGNPLKKARELLLKEEKELALLTGIVGKREKVIETIGLITFKTNFESSMFELTRFDFDEKNIIINGNTDNIKVIEELKNNLINSKKFETVTLDTKNISSSFLKFTLTIRKEL